MIRLSKIEAQGIRGIPVGWPPLPVGPRGLFLCGPNGTGKTSVIDSVEFLLTHNSTLFSEKRMGVNWEAAKQHIRATTVSASLTLTDGSREFRIQYGRPQIPEAVKAWCEGAARSSFLLRRYMLLRFIDAQPKGRYDQLEPFLKLDAFIELEARLGRIVATQSSELSSLKAQINGSSQILRNALGIPFSEYLDVDSVLLRVNAKLHEAGIDPCVKLGECDSRAEVIRTRLESDKPSANYLRLMRVREDAQQAFAVQVFADELMSSLSR